jgi:hypothetical protein
MNGLKKAPSDVYALEDAPKGGILSSQMKGLVGLKTSR